MTWSPPISRSSPPSINSAKLRISLSAQHRVENTFGPSVNQVCFHEPSGSWHSTTQRPRRCRACSTERNSDERLRRWRRKCRVSLDIAGSLSRVRATAPRSLGCHARGAEFEPNKCLGQSVGRSGKCGAWRSLSWKVRIVRLVVTHTHTPTPTSTPPHFWKSKKFKLLFCIMYKLPSGSPFMFGSGFLYIIIKNKIRLAQ